MTTMCKLQEYVATVNKVPRINSMRHEVGYVLHTLSEVTAMEAASELSI